MDSIKDFLKFIFYIFAHLLRTPKPRPIALESSALGGLPIELILIITSFLPRSSITSFSLCCRPINAILGTTCLPADRQEFLTLLERDLPDHILCCHCVKLHAMEKADRYSPPTSQRLVGVKRPCFEANIGAGAHLHRYFSFIIFQMAMKAYRQGLDCSKLLSLLSHESQANRLLNQCTALARIVAGSLLLRQQTVHVYGNPTRAGTLPYPCVSPCNHVHFYRADGSDRHNYTDLVKSSVKDFRNLKGISRCRYCHTEFLIEFVDFGKQVDVMVVTTWKDLGEGQSFRDLRYNRHLYEGYIRYLRGTLPLAEYEQRSIRDRFNGKESSEDAVFDGALFPSRWSILRLDEDVV